MKRNLSLLKLIALLVVLPILVWTMTLSRTFGLWRDWRAALAESDSVIVPHARRSVIGSEPALSNGGFVGKVSELCTEHSVSVLAFSPSELGSEGDLRLCGADLVLSGDFKSLLQVLEAVEAIPEIRICSAAFNSYRPSRTSLSVMLRLSLRQLESTGQMDKSRHGRISHKD